MNTIFDNTVPRDREQTYRRLLEILADYWLEVPEEDEVQITLLFRKGSETQLKCLKWNRKE